MRTYFEITKFRDHGGGLLIEARATETDGLPITRADIVRDAAPLLQGGTLGLQIMNRPAADAGVVTHASFADGIGQIAALVTDPEAIRKIKARVFKGLSAVASPLKRLADGVISRLSMEEVSLVDRPFDPNEIQTIWRAAPPPRTAASGTVAPVSGPALRPTDQQVRDELARMTPEERALTITKAALRLPIKT
jgi:hypothetical protein